MKTLTRKLGAVLLALCLCFSLCCTALAATSTEDEGNFSVTVTGAADGETYSAYKIFDVTYDTDAGAYAYTIGEGSAWYGIVAAADDVFDMTASGDSGTYMVTVKEGVEDDAVIAVFTKAGVPAGVEADASVQATGGTAVLEVSDPGYYYVTTTLGSLVIIDTTDPAPTIAEKNGTPTLSKWVHENTDPADTWGHEDDAANEELVLFEIEIDHINGAVNLVLHDSMDEELEIPDTADFHMQSMILYTSEDADGIDLEEGTDYTISVGACTVENCPLNNCAFEVQFLRSFDDVDETGRIVLTYQLLLNTDGDDYQDDFEEIDNFALVSFGTTGFSEEVKAETYSFGFETFKYTGSEQTPLEGVKFELQNEDGQTGYFYYEADKNIYLFDGWGTPADPDYDPSTELVTGADGMIYLEGLDAGTYYLYETEALSGYNPLDGPVTVTIEAEYDEETGDLLSFTVTYSYGDESGTGVVSIENNTGSKLPGTGGIGTTIFYIIGGVLIVGAVVVLVTRRRMNRGS